MRKLELGRVVATPGALDAAFETGELLTSFIERHTSGDWGDVCKEDWKANDLALDPYDPSRVISSYKLKDGTKLLVITEWDRSATTVLLVNEY